MHSHSNSFHTKSSAQASSGSSRTHASSRGKSSQARQLSAREVALNVLTDVDASGSYSNLQLNQELVQAKLERADAGLATEIVYGTIAHFNTIDYFLNPFVSKGLNKLQPWVRSLLRLSFYQLYYLDRIPAHAAVNEAVNIANRRGHQGVSGMVNGVLRNVLRQLDELQIPDGLSAVKRISLQYSHPEWLVKRWIKQYGEETTEQICMSNNEPPTVSVRVNTNLVSRQKMLDILNEQGYYAQPSAIAPDGIVLGGSGNMALTDWYRSGQISIQDESSMLVAEAVQPQPGMDVLDCCAAPGGKTAHLAEKMQNSGRIIANDIHEHKRKLIDDQAERLHISVIETTVGDAMTLSDRYPAASFDRILLDAPCSGLGVIRRKPDLKWNKTAADIGAITELQQQLLEKVAPLLKPDGILVYSTCTIERSENEDMMRRFLEAHEDFEVALNPLRALLHNTDAVTSSDTQSATEHHAAPTTIGVQILPQDYHSDGFYIAALRRVR
ncbi:16S rRNA (cytosine(967)-C(5))-methyltransferase RsmB [Paenibacillus sp. WLX2291]|uniref:16S rRNA (cytosine(967)-C(5))-methyltransferase RsmB n=1 Tax=Paenibacillus sp. WLX2291 TaxID=3296934 RepID=UPI0039843F8A